MIILLETKHMLNKADRRNTLCEVTIAGNDQPHPLSARRLPLNTSSTSSLHSSDISHWLL